MKKTYISLVSTRLGYVHNNYLKYIPKYNGALWTAMTTSKNQNFHKTVVYLRIDKGSPRGALYLGTCIHNNESCNGIVCIL